MNLMFWFLVLSAISVVGGRNDGSSKANRIVDRRSTLAKKPTAELESLLDEAPVIVTPAGVSEAEASGTIGLESARSVEKVVTLKDPTPIDESEGTHSKESTEHATKRSSSKVVMAVAGAGSLMTCASVGYCLCGGARRDRVKSSFLPVGNFDEARVRGLARYSSKYN